MSHLTNEQKAYIAGIIDGEGHIGLYSCRDKKGWLRSVIGVCNTYKPLLDYLKITYGGCISEQRRDPNIKHRPTFGWQIASKSACKKVLEDTLPYLTIKKEQAILLLEFCNTGGWRKMTTRDYEISRLLKELKKVVF
jgi:hypothetical protein